MDHILWYLIYSSVFERYFKELQSFFVVYMCWNAYIYNCLKIIWPTIWVPLIKLVLISKTFALAKFSTLSYHINHYMVLLKSNFCISVHLPLLRYSLIEHPLGSYFLRVSHWRNYGHWVMLCCSRIFDMTLCGYSNVWFTKAVKFFISMHDCCIIMWLLA